MSKVEIINNEIEDKTKLEDVDNNKIYTGKNDEEVLNCEGGPCNFVYKDINDEE